MQIVRLIVDFRLSETRLGRAIRCQAPLCHTTNLTRHLADVMDRIEGLHPESEQELQVKIEFFLARARERSAGALAIRDLNIALDLMEQQSVGLLRPEGLHIRQERELIERMASRAADFGAVCSLVNQSTVRASMYDTEHRMVGFSRPNAVFYGRARASVMDRHITALVGDHRYTSRARTKMDRVMAGAPQFYTYPLDLPGVGLRVMECAMAPVRDTAGRTSGIVMTVDDISARMGV